VAKSVMEQKGMKDR